MLNLNRLYHGDCLELMKDIDDKSIDMICCDLPYSITNCKWDTIIPFDQLWNQYKRIIKDNGAIVLTASQPFTSALVMSNPKWFKYSLVWIKNNSTGFLNAKKMPLRKHEDVLVFYKRTPIYNPQFTEGKPYTTVRKRNYTESYNPYKPVSTINEDGKRYPTSVIEISCERGLHPTQKPVPLFEHLIRTYTNEGDIVLDNCAGSCTTAIAAINTNRNWICMEKDEHYYNAGLARVKFHTLSNSKF